MVFFQVSAMKKTPQEPDVTSTHLSDFLLLSLQHSPSQSLSQNSSTPILTFSYQVAKDANCSFTTVYSHIVNFVYSSPLRRQFEERPRAIWCENPRTHTTQHRTIPHSEYPAHACVKWVMCCVLLLNTHETSLARVGHVLCFLIHSGVHSRDRLITQRLCSECLLSPASYHTDSPYHILSAIINTNNR